MSKVLKTSAQGRKCMYPGCTHNLSIYNHDCYCHQHRDEMAEKQKPKAIKIDTRRTEELEINEAGDGFVTSE
jgi:hypothetical protein